MYHILFIHSLVNTHSPINSCSAASCNFGVLAGEDEHASSTSPSCSLVKGQRLTEFCQENALVIANTLFQQHKRKLYTWTSRWSTSKSDWLYSLQPKMKKLYTVSKNKTGGWLWLRSWTPYCQIQTEIEESRANHWTIQVWPRSNPLCLYSGSDWIWAIIFNICITESKLFNCASCQLSHL